MPMNGFISSLPFTERALETDKGKTWLTESGIFMILACELCGQPAARQNPTLCAECYYRYWYWQKATMPVTEQTKTIPGSALT